MAKSSRTVTFNALASSTREKWHKNGVPQDTIFEAIPTLNALRNKGSFKMKSDGGEVIGFNVINDKNSTGTWYAGYEPGDTSPQDEFTRGNVEWRSKSWTTAISGMEVFKNKTPEKVFDLLKEKEAVTYMTATEEMNASVWDIANYSVSANTTGTNNKAIYPIPAWVQKDPTVTCALGNINQLGESYWRNRTKDGSAGTSFDAYKNIIRNAINTANRGRGAGMADLVVFDQISYEMLEAALEDRVRYMQTEKASPGFTTINWKGTECIWDVYVPDANAGTNGGPEVTLINGSIYILNSKCMKFYCGKDFVPTPFVDGTYQGQDAKLSMTLFYGQLMADSRRNLSVVHTVPVAFV